MALIRARALGEPAFVVAAGADGRVPGPGFGGGGGVGRAAVGVLPVGGTGTGGALGWVGARAPGAAGFASRLATGQPATFGGGAAALGVSGVPHRAQNLKLAAFSVMQFGHCLGAPPDCCSFCEGVREGGFIRVGSTMSSPGMCAPHERHEPTSVSLWAPHFGQSMWPVVVRARKEGQGACPLGNSAPTLEEPLHLCQRTLAVQGRFPCLEGE